MIKERRLLIFCYTLGILSLIIYGEFIIHFHATITTYMIFVLFFILLSFHLFIAGIIYNKKENILSAEHSKRRAVVERPGKHKPSSYNGNVFIRKNRFKQYLARLIKHYTYRYHRRIYQGKLPFFKSGIFHFAPFYITNQTHRPLGEK